MADTFVAQTDTIISHHRLRPRARSLEKRLEGDDPGNQYAVRKGRRGWSWYVVRIKTISSASVTASKIAY
jgi:hypothetical protein